MLVVYTPVLEMPKRKQVPLGDIKTMPAVVVVNPTSPVLFTLAAETGEVPKPKEPAKYPSCHRAEEPPKFKEPSEVGKILESKLAAETLAIAPRQVCDALDCSAWVL